jgi:hypothetical protein
MSSGVDPKEEISQSRLSGIGFHSSLAHIAANLITNARRILALETDTLPVLVLALDNISPSEAPDDFTSAAAYPSPKPPYQNAGLEKTLGMGSSLYHGAKAGAFSPQMTIITFEVVSMLEMAGTIEQLINAATSEVLWISEKKIQVLIQRPAFSQLAESREMHPPNSPSVIELYLNVCHLAVWQAGDVKVGRTFATICSRWQGKRPYLNHAIVAVDLCYRSFRG